jgi:hypothetical protein
MNRCARDCLAVADPFGEAEGAGEQCRERNDEDARQKLAVNAVTRAE